MLKTGIQTRLKKNGLSNWFKNRRLIILFSSETQTNHNCVTIVETIRRHKPTCLYVSIDFPVKVRVPLILASVRSILILPQYWLLYQPRNVNGVDTSRTRSAAYKLRFMNGDLSRLNARVTIIIVTRRIHVHISGQLGGRTVAIHRFEPPPQIYAPIELIMLYTYFIIYIYIS